MQREYFDADGICRIGTQTAYAVAIYMELTDRVDENGRLLAQKIRENGMHLDTGFVGTPYLCPALTKSGQHETAVDLLLQEDAPGWLNEVRLGATTIWEAWDALDARGHLTGDASLNHYAYGSVAEWMYADLCGIRPTEDAPGFARARIEPKPSERLGSASASVDTASGVYRAAWRCEGRTVSVDITVPFAGTALLCLPEAGIREELSAGTYHYTYEDC